MSFFGFSPGWNDPLGGLGQGDYQQKFEVCGYQGQHRNAQWASQQDIQGQYREHLRQRAQYQNKIKTYSEYELNEIKKRNREVREAEAMKFLNDENIK